MDLKEKVMAFLDGFFSLFPFYFIAIFTIFQPYNVVLTKSTEFTTMINSEKAISIDKDNFTLGQVDVKDINKNETMNVAKNSSSSNTNVTNLNYIIEYRPLVFDSPEDVKTQQEWGENCTLADWDSCKVLDRWFGKYEDPKDGEIKEYLIDCQLEPILCLKNSWTVTRCNLLCMSRCNKEIQFKYDKYVSHSGECQAHSHG